MRYVLALAAGLMLIGTTVPSFADITSGSAGGGFVNCYNWCIGHNKPGGKRLTCFQGCDKYWTTHTGVMQMSSPPPPPHRPVFGGLRTTGPVVLKPQPVPHKGFIIVQRPQGMRAIRR